MAALLEPGMLVRHPEQPDWGLGQVQSNIDNKVTVNFEHAGKVVIDMKRVFLMPVAGSDHRATTTPGCCHWGTTAGMDSRLHPQGEGGTRPLTEKCTTRLCPSTQSPTRRQALTASANPWVEIRQLQEGEGHQGAGEVKPAS